MSGSQATARSRELLAVEHNDADAAHPGRILLAGGSEAASPSKVASPVKNGERGANGPIGVGAPRAKPDFSKLPKPPSALLAKLNAFMPKMQAANDTLKEAMKTRPAEDFDIEHVEDDDDASDSDSASGILGAGPCLGYLKNKYKTTMFKSCFNFYQKKCFFNSEILNSM